MRVETNRAETGTFLLLLSAIAFAPLPLGSNRPLAAAALAFTFGVLLSCVTVFYLARGTRFWVLPPPLRISLALYSVVCVWIGFQASPYTPPCFRDPIWNLSAAKVHAITQGAISINPSTSFSVLMHLFTYFSAFWLSYIFSKSNERARTMLVSLVGIGAVYSLYGMLTYFLLDNDILFFSRTVPQHAVASTFVNRNNFATFAGLSALCSLGLLIHATRPLLLQRHQNSKLIVRLIEQILVHNRGIFGAFLISTIAVLLSTSRGGTTGTLCGALSLAIILLRRKLSLSGALSTAASATVVGALLYGAAGQHLSERLTNLSDSRRISIYELTLDAIRTAPWTGIGAGAFADAAPAYKTSTFSPAIAVTKAHNTYLENTLEFGIPASLCLLGSIALIVRETWRGAKHRRRHAYIPAIGVGASVLVGLHSLIDFSLQIPAVAIFYASLLGIAVAQSDVRRTTSSDMKS